MSWYGFDFAERPFAPLLLEFVQYTLSAQLGCAQFYFCSSASRFFLWGNHLLSLTSNARRKILCQLESKACSRTFIIIPSLERFTSDYDFFFRPPFTTLKPTSLLTRSSTKKMEKASRKYKSKQQNWVAHYKFNSLLFLTIHIPETYKCLHPFSHLIEVNFTRARSHRCCF